MFGSGIAQAARRRWEVADNLQITPELIDGGSLQLAVNMMMHDRPVMPDRDPEEPGRVLDRKLVVGFHPGYESRIVGGAKGGLGIILQRFIQTHRIRRDLERTGFFVVVILTSKQRARP
jgi:hypothetical protein